MDPRHTDVCIALAATEEFIPGALVAVHSFLSHHPGFGGGIVLFHDGLPEERRTALAEAFPPLRFEPVRPELRERLERLAASPLVPWRCAADFHRLEALRIVGYRKVLYLDSDLLFRKPIDELLASDDALICCGDRASINGWVRDAATFQPIRNRAAAGPAGALERTFNSGLLLMDGRAMGERAYSEVLALATPETWRGTETVHTDQLLLNRHFAGRQTVVSSAYNYSLQFSDTIMAQEGVAPADAKVLHFTGPVKPWNAASMLRLAGGVLQFRPHAAHSWWHEAWMACLTEAHLRWRNAHLRWRNAHLRRRNAHLRRRRGHPA